MVIRKAKIIEHDKLIQNSHNKAKTTWGIINKESGRNKKRSAIQALNVENKKSPINKIFLKLLMSILLLMQKMLKDKIIVLMMITIVWIITLISWNKLLIILTQAWKVNAH
jgi:hypothetical protein